MILGKNECEAFLIRYLKDENCVHSGFSKHTTINIWGAFLSGLQFEVDFLKIGNIVPELLVYNRGQRLKFWEKTETV